MDVTLFFDKETFRHVRTEYKRKASASIGRTIDESSRQSETRFKVSEDYSEFKEFEGITMPTKYRIHYSMSGANGTTEVAWTCIFTEFAFNQKFEPSSFEIGK